MTRFLLVLVLAGCASADCLPITRNRILGRDLAAADSQFAALPATLTVGFAPAPGTKRVFDGAELERLARANGISVRAPAEICFELPMRQIAEEEVTAAMRSSLPADATLRIVELAKTEVPAGQIEFPIEGLEPAPPATPGTQLWRGYDKYAETRKVAIWARVSVTVRFTAVIAEKDLSANAVINSAALRIETRTGPLPREKVAIRMEDVSGRMPKLALKAGSWIPLATLVNPPTVRRGDSVRVEVESGPARLHFEAVAENAANEGELVELRNPLNGKIFRARLEAGGGATLIVPAGHTQ
jgi:flagella basal body P-ring formation protein FlgA